MKALIFGKGYIGESYLKSDVFRDADLAQADITVKSEIVREVEKHKPEVLINCAGKTNLEWCRDNAQKALLANVKGPLNILEVARQKGLYLVHIGSGCIFEGAGSRGGGFTEKDAPNPAAYYSLTKVLADELLLDSGYNKLLIFRIRQPFSNNPHPRNLLSKLLSYDKLITSPNSATCVSDLVEATDFLLKKRATGIFNICNSGTISPFEIVSLAKEIVGLDKNFIPISKSELDKMDKENGREKRVDTVINISKLESWGFKMPDVRSRIADALKNFK